MIDQIKEKVQELFQSTPDYVNVGYGKKNTNGEFTDENCIVFMVEKKETTK